MLDAKVDYSIRMYLQTSISYCMGFHYLFLSLIQHRETAQVVANSNLLLFLMALIDGHIRSSTSYMQLATECILIKCYVRMIILS